MGFSTAAVETIEKPKFGPMPDGNYPFIVNNFSEKTTLAGNKMYSLDALCLHPEYDRRRIFVNFNVENGNDEVAKRGQSDCKEFVEAAMNKSPAEFEEAEELNGLQFVARVYTGKEKDKEGNFRMVNKIGDFFNASTPTESAAAKPASKPIATAPRASVVAGANKGPASWANKAKAA